MRGKSSSSSSSSRVKAMEMPSKSKEEPQLSGAYIRSLVKHLSSSRPKENPNPKSPNSILEDRIEEAPPLQSPPPPPQPKKQVRRRLHTSRPYQERLLNMAEARREIVTALKFHRASMKQANEQQQQQKQQQALEDSMRNPNPSPNPSPNMYQQDLPNFTYPSIPWSYPTLAPLPNIHDNLNIPLPNTPLGLNLNFQGFNNIDPLIIHPISPHSSSSSSFSYSSPTICGIEAPVGVLGTSTDTNTDTVTGDAKMHLAMGEREMEEIRFIGEKHDMEWNDTVNLVTSAWWSKFLDTMEVDTMEGTNAFRAFDQEAAVDIPSWLKDGSVGDASANASNLLMQHLDDYYSQDASLPW